MLPGETLLDVASFLDYATLVMLQVTNKQLLAFITRYADELALRRTLIVSYAKIYRGFIIKEARADNSHAVVQRIELDGTDNERITGVAVELQSHIGPHAVSGLYMYNINFSLKLLVDLVPPLRFASEVYLLYAKGSLPTTQEYVEDISLFERPTWTGFRDIPFEALVVFLQSANASRLTCWSAWAPPAESGCTVFDAAMENAIFRAFTNDEHVPRWKTSLVGWNLRWDFLRRLIEASENLQHEKTIVVSKPSYVLPERLELDDGFCLTYWRLPLDPESFEEKSVAVLDFLRRGQRRKSPWIKLAYFSKHSDVVVFVQGDTITISSNLLHIDFATSYANDGH